MEAIIFCGIQASGKTTFYKEHFFKSHLRISLDLLHTRHKEDAFIHTCLVTQQRYVVDNTNATKKQRDKYIQKAKTYKYKVIGYYFYCTLGEAIARNKNRTGKEHVPIAGIGGTLKKLEIPMNDEGFDEIFWVEIANNNFIVKKVETIAE